VRGLRRPRIVPPTLREGGVGHSTARRHRKERQADPEAKLGFVKHWHKSDVRGALYSMHGWVCAYCQCALGRSRGDVEHFRPTSIYWWLAYDFSNLFLSCGTCNRERKIGRFPLDPGAEPTSFAQRAEIPREARQLLHPVEDPVEDYLSTDFEDKLCRVVNRVDKQKQPSAWTRVETTVRIFRLNLDLPLLKERIGRVRESVELLDNIDSAPDSQDKLRRMASRFAPHGMTVRGILEARQPNLLPTPAAELRWLFDDFVHDLARIRNLLKQSDEKFLRDQEDEIRWALAVLLKESSSSEIEAWLAEAGIYDEILSRCEEL
jgi:uncharacterized protein (TIGR02646 family)